MMSPLIAVALQVFPELVRYLGGANKTNVIDAVVESVSKATNTRDPAKARAALADSPALTDELRISLAEIAAKAETDRRKAELDELKTRLGDTQNARGFALSAAQSGGPMALGSLGISFVVSISFVALLMLIVMRPQTLVGLEANGAAFQIVNITLGALTAAFVTVVGFWLGSSQGSRNKDSASYQLQSQQAEQSRESAMAQASQSELIVQQSLSRESGDAKVVPQKSQARSGPGRFSQCIDIILQKEGGYVDDPRDSGGATNMGITFATLKEWRKDKVSNEDITKEDVQNLTVDEAKEIYFAKYWNALRCDELPAGVDLVVFDFGVNAGVGRAAKVLQKCLHVEADGAIGDITLGAIKTFNAADLVRRYGEARMTFYKGLKNFAAFGKGWTSRVRQVEAIALGMTSNLQVAA